MSVLAGVFDSASAEFAISCSQILLSQGVLGGRPHQICRSGRAEFGIARAEPNSVSDFEGYLLVADARIDNRDDILAHFNGPARRPYVSDAEVLSAAWAAGQSAALDRVVGDYALAVYDSRAQSLALARDPTGQRPLFFKVHGSTIAFASLPYGLTNLFSPSAPNLALLAKSLESVPGDLGESFFCGVQKVAPGEIVEFSNGILTRRYHWQPEIDGIPENSGEDYVRSYRAVLDAAVRSRISSGKAPIASQLSSGLDSSAVTATAAMVRPQSDLIAFTAAPQEAFADRLIRHRFADESTYAAQTARMHGIRHVIIRETPPLFDVVRSENRHLQAPVRDPFNMAWWAQIRREAEQMGARTLLTGEIGNLTLNAGNLYLLTAFIQRRDWTGWLREAMRLTRQQNVRWRGILVNSFGHRLPDLAHHRLRRLFQGIPGPAARSFIRREWRERVRQEETRPSSNNPYQWTLDAIRQMDYGLQRKAALAGHGIDELDPLSDRRILDFAMRVPPDELIREGATRALARRALRDRVPASVLDLPIRGLQSADWHLRISKQAARDAFESISGNSDVQDLLDLPKIDRAIRDWPTSDLNSYTNIITYRNQLVPALSAGIYLTETDLAPAKV